jgi:hypothetical protein
MYRGKKEIITLSGIRGTVFTHAVVIVSSGVVWRAFPSERQAESVCSNWNKRAEMVKYKVIPFNEIKWS